MGFFKYPYTDLNELNLDWVIARIKELTEYVATITNADQISYDNTGTILSAENVQDAINEILNVITTGAVTSFNGRTGAVLPAAHDYTGQQVDYDKTGTTLTSDDVQGAIAELAARPLGGVQSFNGRTGAILPGASDYDATDIAYDNTTSGMTATTTQGALDELDSRLDNFTVAAGQVTYDNTQSGLTATDAQAAIDEIANDVLSSGVASFNGRTGAVNPAAGDYDASDITYDNTGSGLTATDSQAAIDEIAGSLNSGLLGFKETITVTNNNYTDTNAVRLADLEAQIITALGQLGNDEKAQLKYVSVANAVWMSTQSPATWLDNTVTALDMRFMIFNVSTSNNRADFQSLRIHPNSANTFYNRLRLEPTPTITITDYTTGTNSNDMIAYIDVYKEVIS